MSLGTFFSAMAPFLRGEQSIDAVTEAIGASESGAEAMTFYATLVRRNYGKILREVFVSVMRASRQLSAELWPQLVREYAARTRVMHHDPNEFGREFPEWLASRQAEHPEQPASLAELADYQWIRHAARHAPRGEGLGLDQRLFVRHYTHAIPKLAAALWREEQVELRKPSTELRPGLPRARRSKAALLLPHRHGPGHRHRARQRKLARGLEAARAADRSPRSGRAKADRARRIAASLTFSAGAAERLETQSPGALDPQASLAGDQVDATART